MLFLLYYNKISLFLSSILHSLLLFRFRQNNVFYEFKSHKTIVFLTDKIN